MKSIFSVAINEYIAISGCIFVGTTLIFLTFKDRKSIGHGILLVLVLTAAYFTRNFLLFIALLFPIVRFSLSGKTTVEKIAYYFLLLPLIPMDVAQIIPFPGLQRLININYPKALNIFIILPIFLGILSNPKAVSCGHRLDKYVILYFGFLFIIEFTKNTFTNSFRHVFEQFINYFIVYFVLSRLAREPSDFNKYFKFAIHISVILALVGIVEVVRTWRLFGTMYTLPNLEVRNTIYAMRHGLLRACASMNNIGFGLFLSMSIGLSIFVMYFNRYFKNKYFFAIISLLFIAMLCTFARAPIVMLFVFLALFNLLVKKWRFKTILVVGVLAVALSVSPIGKKVVSALPFIGKEEQGSVKYRQLLLKKSIIVIKRSPFIGNADFQDEPEIQELALSGGGLPGGKVDIVNSYLGIALRQGLVGLGLFILVVWLAFLQLWKAICIDKNEDTATLGKVLLSLLVAYLVAIFTVSLLDLMQLYIWALIGLSGGYAGMIDARSKLQIAQTG